VIYAEGEDERVLHAVRVVLDEGLARPILIGRPDVIEMRIKKIGLNLVPERDFESSIRSPIRAIASCGPSTTSS
jgi:Phosphotransacetylase